MQSHNICAARNSKAAEQQQKTQLQKQQLTIDQVVVLNGEKVVGGFGSRGSSLVVEVFW
jgi:3-oxoacyl-ACP reductase-like protein